VEKGGGLQKRGCVCGEWKGQALCGDYLIEENRPPPMFVCVVERGVCSLSLLATRAKQGFSCATQGSSLACLSD
jgi:hypothetical protein